MMAVPSPDRIIHMVNVKYTLYVKRNIFLPGINLKQTVCAVECRAVEVFVALEFEDFLCFVAVESDVD